MSAQLQCFDNAGQPAALVVIGHDGRIEQVQGDMQLARETIALLAADPFAKPTP